MLSQSRNRFFDKIKSSNFVAMSAGTTLVASIILLDFICSEKLQHDNINWEYYTDTPTRIIWGALSAIFQGINLIYVIRILNKEAENNTENKSSALKALAISTAYSTSMAFANFSLTSTQPPITLENWGYVTARACLNGGLAGPIMSSGIYFLKKLNFTIRPITLEHFKLISAGIILVMMQELLNFVSDQMIKKQYIEWDGLISTPRSLAWHAIVIATTGVLYGITKYSYKTYSHPEDGSMNVLNKILLPTMACVNFITTFTNYAMTLPITADNAPYVATRSLSAITDGIVAGANFSILLSLFRRRQNPTPSQTPLLSETSQNTSVAALTC